MKKIFSFIILLLSIQLTQAQDNWIVKLNGKTILTANKQDTVANTKKIDRAEWNKTGYLEVLYKEATPSPWLHSFYIADKKEETSLTKDSTTRCKIPLSTLRKTFAGKKEIDVYMVLSPPNPMMGAPTRRLLLCTLLLP